MSEVVNERDQLLEKQDWKLRNPSRDKPCMTATGTSAKSLIGLVLALVITQLLLHYEPSRPYISPIQQMEGVPVNEPNVNDWMVENTPSLLHHSS